MFRLIRHRSSRVAALVALCASSMVVGARGQRPQDRVTVDQSIRFAKGATSAVVTKRIRLGTTHNYRVSAREGQKMSVVLKTGKQTSFTVAEDNVGILEDADGVTSWQGTLPRTGEYVIEIGTDANASYTLEVRIE